MATPLTASRAPRDGYQFRPVGTLGGEIARLEKDIARCGRILAGKLSEDDRTIWQTKLRNAEKDLSRAKWELTRQTRGVPLDGMDTSAGVADGVGYSQYEVVAWTENDHGGPMPRPASLDRSGKPAARDGWTERLNRIGPKIAEVRMREEITLSELQRALGLRTKDMLYTAIENKVLATVQYSGQDSRHHVEVPEARRYIASLGLSPEKRQKAESALDAIIRY